MALQSQQAARALPSKSGHGSLRGDIFILGSKVDSNELDASSTVRLLGRVVEKAPDAEIWNAVYDLVELTNTKPTTPPTALQGSVLDTPLRSSSASQSGTEQTHHEVDQRILEELTDRVFYDVGGFYERYFTDKHWTGKARKIYDGSRHYVIHGCWDGYPRVPVQALFFNWFMTLQDTVLDNLPRRYYTSANKALTGSDAGRKLDIFLSPPIMSDSFNGHDWSQVLVIGEHKQNPGEDTSTKTLVQLAGYAREVFGSQPDRRFVPGFTICGSLMRLWIFDRSGSYCSEAFDIHKEPERFVTVIAGYALMSDAELGLNTFIKSDNDGKYVTVRGTRISLEDRPIASTKAIVCRGTTCYRGRESISEGWEYVVKFAWPSEKRQREGRLLKLAKDRGVRGIAEWFSHDQVSIDGNLDSISQLRQNLVFGSTKRLSRKVLRPEGGMECSQPSTESLRGRSGASKSQLAGLGIATNRTTMSSSGSKRKRPLQPSNRESSVKRSRSNAGRGSLLATKDDAGDDNSNHGTAHSIESTEEDSLVGDERETYSNRIHCCLVVSPAGRPLHKYRSVKELLQAFRDAIAGHRSLLEDGKILHRDISENNIIITDGGAAGGPVGRLIDLDLAKELDSLPSGASHRTGTMQFMAIEVLQGKGHTYRHDLESFFYVFIWMCIRYGYNHESTSYNSAVSSRDVDKRRIRSTGSSILRGWYTGTYAEIANIKRGHMVGFDDVTAEFAPGFIGLKTLAGKLRDVLFPIRGSLFTGTYKDRSIIYEGMIDAFDKAIDLI